MLVKSKKLLLLIALFGALRHSAYGGGFMIIEPSVRLNGQVCGSTFRPHTSISMTYLVEEYSFTGGSNRFVYYIFKLQNKQNGEIRFAYHTARKFYIDYNHDYGYKFVFSLPKGDYEISYSMIPAFTSRSLDDYSPDLPIRQAELSKRFGKSASTGYFRKVCNVKISDAPSEFEDKLSVYLQVNGRTPGLIRIDSSVKKLSFRFLPQHVTNEKEIQYRYRMLPDEGWSPWQIDNETGYYFLNHGYHDFEVQCRFKKNVTWDTLKNSVLYHFKLDKPFIADKINSDEYKLGDELEYIDKGDIKRKTKSPQTVLADVYDSSKALLIGVESFNDNKFSPLPYIRNDINITASTFSDLHFNIKKSKGQKREAIMNDIRSELASLKKNDRLVIYISSHGFIDPISKKALVATKECSRDNPIDAISIEEIKDLIKGPGVKCRHILLILDCCASGMSIMEKNGSLGAVRTLATEKGTWILSAGMSDQNAKMVETLRMSLFTYYLTEGLKNKKADYTKDGIITLSELLVYVQFNVASKTNSEQVPVSGRISGSGEMIFF